jgi:tetratricopeptide (TPR) repeat protein
VIAGTAGVGKTALAVRWAHQMAAQFPDGQLWVNLRGFDPAGQIVDPATALRRFLDSLGVPADRIPADPQAQAALYRSELADRRMLVVLDNARDTAQVRPLLPASATCMILVTSRNRLTGLIAAEGARPVVVDLLADVEARLLLANRLGPTRVAAEPDPVTEIITRCARLPLALAIVAARASADPQLPLTALAEQLRGAAGRLDALTTDDPTTDVRAVFSWSYRSLTPAAARLFRLVGLHPGPDLGAAAAGSLAGLPLPRTEPLIAELTGANLLVEHPPRRYTCHDLLRAYAIDRADAAESPDQRDGAVHRLLDYYLHTTYVADRLLYPARDAIALTGPQAGVQPDQFADRDQALAWFTAEHAVLVAAVRQAADTGFDARAWQLAWSVAIFLDRHGYWHDLATVERTAVAAARRLADPQAQAHAHRLLARADIRLRRFEAADTQLQHALELFGRAGDALGQAHTHNVLAVAFERQERYTEALDHARQALDLFSATGHRQGQAEALNSVGWLYAVLGDYQRALTACQEAVRLLQDLDDRHGLAATWDSLGYAHHQLRDYPRALACYQQALDLNRDLGNRYYEAEVLTHVGDTHHATGDAAAAHRTWQQALAILDQLDNPDSRRLRARLATVLPPQQIQPESDS